MNDVLRERAESRTSEWAGPDTMSWQTADISVERVRPPVRNDDEALAPMRGLLIGVVLGVAFWALVLLVAFLVSA